MSEIISSLPLLMMAVLSLVLLAEVINGWTDAPNALATVVSSGTLPIRVAVPCAVLFNILGAMAGTAVASTIGTGIVAPESVTLPTIGAAMVAIIAWGWGAQKLGLPVSKSHALLAGLAGAAMAMGGWDALLFEGWIKILWGLGASLVGGFIIAFLLGLIASEVLLRVPASPTRRIVAYLLIAAFFFMCFAHGMNDGQKFIGIFELVRLKGGATTVFQITWTTIMICSITMGIGTACGGWKIVKTLGRDLGRFEPWQGMVATTTASSLIATASSFGIPISTTHSITSSIVGSNSARGLHRVKWDILSKVMKAWIFTFPGCAFIAYLAATLAIYVEKFFT